MLFPDDIQFASTDQNSSTLSGYLLTSSTIDRTLYYGTITTNDNDAHISIKLNGVTTTPWIDLENGAGHQESFNQVLLPAGSDLMWSKTQTNKSAFFTVNYTNYNIASTTPNTVLQKDNSLQVILLLILVGIGLIDLFRRIFMPTSIR